ncbi:MAG: methyltransferase domain-containing protein [Hyphomonadaceae bacterium]|nr:methyltransferase domain-containing protein [Hyphomonadaceae bacterium]
MNARVAAAELLIAVLDNGRALEDAMEQTQSYNRLEGRDRAFARALATAGLRRLGSVNAVLSRMLERPLPETAFHGRALLHIGATQLLVLGTPAHAAVGETVEAANSLREARGFAKLMNAVLRRVSREGAEIMASLPPGADLPAWLYTRWRAAYGDVAPKIAQALAQEPPLDISVKDDPRDWSERLVGAVTPTGSVRLASHGGVEQLYGFEDGAWWVQDAAASLPAKLLGDVRGKRVLDLCAAPGGKTLQLAAAGAQVTAVDKSDARLKRLRENLARTKLSAEVICADALEYRAEPFDAVLLDAPCTSTGTLRRHPDVAWLRRPMDVRALAELQGKLLAASRALLKPGGQLVYAVCSMEPEEGQGVVAEALKHGWRRAPLTRGEIAGADDFVTADGDLRTLPAHWPEIGGLDGFFAARLTRT